MPKTRHNFDVTRVWRHSDTEDELPGFLCGRNIVEYEIVWRAKGYEVVGPHPDDYDIEETRSLVEANAYTATEYVPLTSDEQRWLWEIWESVIGAEPLEG